MRTCLIHQSLVLPIMVMGVPRNIFWANVLLTMDLVYFGAWWLIAISITFHLFARNVCKQDPHFFAVLKRYYLDGDDYLEP